MFEYRPVNSVGELITQLVKRKSKELSKSPLGLKVSANHYYV